MRWLYPKLRARWLPTILGLAVLGALIAGLYGIAHDQITYTLAPEYFTRLKFRQFHYADFGWPVRVLVAEIGFLATWWVGAFAGWFLARLAIPHLAPREVFRAGLRGFWIMLAFAATAGGAGYAYGLVKNTAFSGIAFYAGEIGMQDVAAFTRVAYIHNAGYLGGLLGLVTALVALRRKLHVSNVAASRGLTPHS